MTARDIIVIRVRKPAKDVEIASKPRDSVCTIKMPIFVSPSLVVYTSYDVGGTLWCDVLCIISQSLLLRHALNSFREN